MRFFVLASAFCLLTSPGLAAFTDTTHNVGVGDILAPRGTVDSGLPVIPRIIVNNYGTATETLWTFMRIGAYLDSAEVIGLPGRGSDSVSFSSWTPAGRDSMAAASWTVCPHDSFPGDDTARARFLLRVTDVAVTAILPPMDTLDSGLVIHPSAWVWNHGNQTQSFPLEFSIDSLRTDFVYCCTAQVVNLIPGGQRLVIAPDSWVVIPGGWVLRIWAMVDGDLRPEDNILYDTFYVRGGRRPGGRVLSFRVGPDTIDTLAIVVPRAVVENNGQGPATFWTWVNVWSPSAHVYSESVQVMLGAGGRIGITFPTARFTELGMHIGRCSLDCDTWATLDDTFWVVAGHGIEERSTPDASRATPGTTLVRGVLFLGAGKRGQSTTGQSLVFLLDAAGRTVMALKPGGNDVRHLPAGVYFIRPAGTVPTGQGAVPIRAKVVIQR